MLPSGSRYSAQELPAGSLPVDALVAHGAAGGIDAGHAHQRALDPHRAGRAGWGDGAAGGASGPRLAGVATRAGSHVAGAAAGGAVAGAARGAGRGLAGAAAGARRDLAAAHPRVGHRHRILPAGSTERAVAPALAQGRGQLGGLATPQRQAGRQHQPGSRADQRDRRSGSSVRRYEHGVSFCCAPLKTTEGTQGGESPGASAT